MSTFLNSLGCGVRVREDEEEVVLGKEYSIGDGTGLELNGGNTCPSLSPSNGGEAIGASAPEMQPFEPRIHGDTEVRFEPVVPWPEPVKADEVLDQLEGVMKRYVVLPCWGAETMALWTLHTYAFHLREVSTYLGVESPAPRCGKTTLMGVISRVGFRTIAFAHINPAGVFRAIHEHQPTLLIDETDMFLHKNTELKGILNAGYTKQTAFVIRVGAQRRFDAAAVPRNSEARSREVHGNGSGEQNGKTQKSEGEVSGGPKLERFSCWCPKVIAKIGQLPSVLADRCIILRMERKAQEEECEELRDLEEEGRTLRRKCARFVIDHEEAIRAARPKAPAGLNNRAADVWEPLFVLADLAGGSWPERARLAAIELSARTEERNPINALLSDIMESFSIFQAERLFSRQLLDFLRQHENRPWAEARNGKPVTEIWLSQQLRPYGIRPRTMWIGEHAAKGYMREDFAEVFRRYLPKGA
jgi:hypothetical protein